ncbi:hypothetical protein Misp01_47040 [Microtetraspora sp. NBRC 13810]|nr:hypothetical protein Misp01_47040 [Microtetraspora sp. NBRC 13810]
MCEHRRPGRSSRRAQMTKGHAMARAGRTARRRGWFAHHGGVSRCGQGFVPERLAHESTWKGRGDE